jgi:hypothetical protein
LTKFSDLGLAAPILRALQSARYDMPTAIQARAIRIILAGRDMLGIAQTGTGADLDRADLVMTGGMLFQQADSLRLIRRAQARGKPIAIGGPDATSSPHIYAAADFRVLGEAEGIIDDFVAAWEAEERAGDFHAPKYQVDVTKSPIPRFDLLRFEDYLFVGVQFSRAARSRANSVTSSSYTGVYHAPRQRRRCWPSSTLSTRSATAATSISSTII